MTCGKTPIHEASGKIRPCGNRNCPEAHVGGEHTSAKLGVALHLQKCGREHPYDRTAKVRQHHTQAGFPQMARNPQEGIASGGGEIGPEDRDFQAIPECPAQRAIRLARRAPQSAGSEQQTHAEKRAALWSHATPADGEFILPHDGEQYPAWSDDQVSEFHQNRRAQTHLRPHITDETSHTDCSVLYQLFGTVNSGGW